jgi:hypothetical protein
VSKNRRRSTGKAEIEEQLTETPEAPKSRRRSPRPPDATEQSPEAADQPAEPQPGRNRRRSVDPAPVGSAPVGSAPVGSAPVEEQSAGSQPGAARSRRRSPQPAPAEDRPAEMAESVGRLAEAGEIRDRRARAGEAEDRLAETAGMPGRSAGAGEARPSRRRSGRTGAVDEPVAERPRESSVGALSGQLPHGAEYRAGEISTEAGRYLRQAARDDAPAKFGAPAGEVDDAARRVWEIAFGLAVRRRFDSETPLAEISRTVATAVHEHAAAALPMLDAEMLVRHALGEMVPVGDLDSSVFVAVHLLLFASIADELALVDEELDAIIAAAEEKASALVPA